MGNTRDTGYLQNIVTFDANDNIVLPADLTIGGSNGFYWDNTNKRLGIGTNVPSSVLHTAGVGGGGSSPIIEATTTTNYVGLKIKQNGDFWIAKDNSTGSAFNTSPYANVLWGNGAYPMIFSTNSVQRWQITSTGILQSNGAQTIQTSSGALTLQPSNNVLIGTTTDNGARLQVSGNQTLTGKLLINSTDTTKTPLLLNAEGNYASSGNMTTGFAITNTSFGRALNMGVFESGAYAWIQAAYINNADTTFPLALQPRGGNVGIGSSGYSSIRLQITGATSNSSAFALALADSSLQDLFYIRNDGYMNTGSRAFSPYNNTSGNAANMVVGADGTIYRSTSSLKYKTDIQDYNKGLSEVLKMRPVYYKSINEREKDLTFAGLIAEEVHNLGLTEFVQYATDGSPDALAYSNMIALLVKGMQELKAELDELKSKN